MISMAIAAVNGITIGYDDQGDPEGVPLVLVHGHPFNRTMWAPQGVRFAASGYRVVTADLRGYGESQVVPGITPREVVARDTAALMDHLGLSRAVIGGLSMGGQIVMEFYRLFPERVTGLVFADTFPRAETDEGKAVRAEMADRLLREGMSGYADEVIDKMLAPYNVGALPGVARQVLGMMRATPPAGAAAALRGRAERPDYCELLSRVSVPALVVVGADDEYTPVSDAEYMHGQLPDSTLTVIEGAGHMPNLERPEEFDAALAAFLRRLPR